MLDINLIDIKAQNTQVQMVLEYFICQRIFHIDGKLDFCYHIINRTYV